MNTDLSPERRHGSLRWLLLPIVAALLALGAVPRFMARGHANAIAADNAIPAVRVVHPRTGPAYSSLMLPASLQPWAEASIRARSSGYVASWTADIGSHVKAGQTLATLVAPELGDALRQANAEQDAAQIAYDLASANAKRGQEMLRTNTTSLQDAQQRDAEMQAARARLSAAQENVLRLARPVAYTRIVAPFDGVITARAVDVGTLVDSGAAPELFHEVQITKLRAVLSVPDEQAPGVRLGLPVEIVAGQRTLGATISRTTETLDPSSRMLRVEADVANGDGALLPGQYAQVTLKSTVSPEGSILPIEAVLYRPSGPVIGVIDATNRVGLRPVRILKDLGTQVVVTPKLPVDAEVVANPGDALQDGATVHPHIDRSSQYDPSPRSSTNAKGMRAPL